MLNAKAECETGCDAKAGAPRAAAMSVVMAAAPAVRQALTDAQAQHKEIPDHVKALLEQVVDMANYAKSALLIFPPDSAEDREWTGVGNEIMPVMLQQVVLWQLSTQRLPLLLPLLLQPYRSCAGTPHLLPLQLPSDQ